MRKPRWARERRTNEEVVMRDLVFIHRTINTLIEVGISENQTLKNIADVMGDTYNRVRYIQDIQDSNRTGW